MIQNCIDESRCVGLGGTLAMICETNSNRSCEMREDAMVVIECSIPSSLAINVLISGKEKSG